MRSLFTFILSVFMLPALLLSNVNERNRYSAENRAISRMEQLINARWSGIKQDLVKKYSYAKSFADFESQLSGSGKNFLVKKSAPKSAGNRSVESRILNDGSLLKTEMYQNWNNSDWLDDAIFNYTYDQSDHLTEFLHADWNEGIWINHWTEKYTFSGDNMVSELWQNWDNVNDTWIDTDQWINEFDGSGNLVGSVYQYWSESNWQNNWRDLFQYNDNGFEIEYIAQEWNGSTWINRGRVVTDRDPNGNVTQYTGQSWDGNSGWTINDYRTVFIYDEADRLTEVLNQDDQGGEFVTHHRDLLSYDENNNMVGVLTQEFNGETYVDIWKLTNVYDAQNNMIEYAYYSWNMQSSSWQNDFKSMMTYDTRGNMIEQVRQMGDGNTLVNYAKSAQNFNELSHITTVIEQEWNNGNWVNSYKGNFEYAGATAITDNLTLLNQWRLEDNYPNPFNPSTTISYQLALESKVDLSIYNLLGQKLVTLVSQQQPAGTYNVKWNASSMPSGVYFYQLQAGSDFIQSKKLILLK